MDTGEIMTVQEIDRRFAGEWVLLSDPEMDEDSGWIARGRVEFHSKDRDEVGRAAIASPAGHIAFHFAGKMPRTIYAL